MGCTQSVCVLFFVLDNAVLMHLNIGCLHFSLEDQSAHALKALLVATILMVTLPIGSYFASKAFVFEGKINLITSNLLISLKNRISSHYAKLL